MKKQSSQIVLSGKAAKIFRKHVRGIAAPVLDCGSSNGAFLDLIPEYTGVMAIDLVPQDLRVQKGSIEKIPMVDASRGVITAWQVLEHVENPSQAFREVKRVLWRGGVFMFSMPNIHTLRNKLHFLKTGEMYRYTDNKDHRTILTPSMMKEMLKGLKLAASGFCGSRRKHLPRFLKNRKFNSETMWFVYRKV